MKPSGDQIDSLREPLRKYIQSVADGWDSLRAMEDIIGCEIDSSALVDALHGHDIPANIGDRWATALDIPNDVIDDFAIEFFQEWING